MMDIFQYPEINFPEGFLWGAATAGQQIEGNSNSDMDLPETAPKYDGYEFAEKACNSYEMYMEDIAVMKQLNLNIYRMSIEWCRLEPEKGVYDREALIHYLHQLNALKEAGIKVCLTLCHFTHPVWFHRKGHFTTNRNMKDWESYLEYIVPQIKEYIDYWIVLNELNLPFRYSMEERLILLEYHAAGYHIIKKHSNKPASSAHAYFHKMPYRGSNDRLDTIVADYLDYMENEFFFHAIRTGEICAPGFDGKYMPELKNSCDFWAINAYTRSMVNGRNKNFLSKYYNAMHFHDLEINFYTEEMYPEIMINALMRLKDKPCMIMENGIGCNDDRLRIVYISSILQSIHESIQCGAEVWGYIHWSLLDNWEWGSYVPRFGLVEVERDTFKRKIKPSGFFYSDIIKNNGYSPEIARKYLDRLPSKIDSGNRRV